MGWRSRNTSGLTTTEPARKESLSVAPDGRGSSRATASDATSGDGTAGNLASGAATAGAVTAGDAAAGDAAAGDAAAGDAAAGDAAPEAAAAAGSAASGSMAAGESAASELTFEDFVRGASTSLHRTAYLLTGSREAAQDAVQTALTRVYLAWDRHGQWENPTAYARQVVVNTVLTGQRRKWTGEIARPELGDRELGSASDRTTEVADRDALRRALDTLPLRQRTAVVLRHYLDLSEAQTAAEMQAPVGTIKSLTARGLDALRTQLQEVHP